MRDVLCWRCTRKLYRVTIPPGVLIPKGLVIEQPCPRCKAMNSLPLDTLSQAAIPCV